VTSEQLDILEPVANVETSKMVSLAEFLEIFEKEAEVEQKIRLSIDFMRAALSQSGNPRFKDFWEGRRMCLPLFKENITATGRTLLWGEYIELSSEARRLKEILDEQSAFAMEQIELAIQSMEKDLEQYSEQLAQIPELTFPETCHSLCKKADSYSSLQRELYLLNTLASRVNGLRKEVIKTEMRVRFKTKFFERLSTIGDKIFPRRKELIKDISAEFIADVEAFIKEHFSQEASVSLFLLREEIKALQNAAKLLTLNTHAFTETRLQLSKCWDQLKEWEKERKKEISQKKAVFKINHDEAMEKIKAYAAECMQEGANEEALLKAGDELLAQMKTLELGNEEVWSLKEAFQLAKRPLIDKQFLIEQERERQNAEREAQRKEKKEQLRADLQTLSQDADSLDHAALEEKRKGLLKSYELLALSKSEKQVFEKLLKQLRDLALDKKDKAAMQLSADDLQSLENLRTILGERKERRQEIKTLLESYRKALGGSGFDFEKAMMYRELIDAEKVRLDTANASIQEIEEKISELEG